MPNPLTSFEIKGILFIFIRLTPPGWFVASHHTVSYLIELFTMQNYSSNTKPIRVMICDGITKQGNGGDN